MKRGGKFKRKSTKIRLSKNNQKKSDVRNEKSIDRKNVRKIVHFASRSIDREIVDFFRLIPGARVAKNWIIIFVPANNDSGRLGVFGCGSFVDFPSGGSFFFTVGALSHAYSIAGRPPASHTRLEETRWLVTRAKIGCGAGGKIRHWPRGKGRKNKEKIEKKKCI